MTADTAGSNSLPELSARILAEHQACEAAHAKALDHAVVAGNMLIEAKAMLKRGQWLPWLRDHCAISERKAQRYMKVAPHVCKSDTLSDLARQPCTEEWCHHRLTGPFNEIDLFRADLQWQMLKLMRHAGVPRLPACLVAEEDVEGMSVLRLCPFDQLEEAIRALAPFASEEAPFRIDVGSMADVLQAIEHLKCLTARLTGKFLIEAKYRFNLADDYSDEEHESDWTRTHTAWMTRLDAQIQDAEAQREGVTP